jgi:lipoprotein signal peptidase
MILGGAMGNLVDRFFRSPDHCRATSWTPVHRLVSVFNIADPRWWVEQSRWLLVAVRF